MKTNKTVRFDPELADQLAEVATQSNVTVAAVVRSACEIYLMRRRLAEDLIQLEDRVAGGLVAVQDEVVRVGNDVQLLSAIVDQLVQFLFAATPEVTDQSVAQALMGRRYDAFIKAIPENFSARKKKSRIAQSVEEIGGE